MNRHFIEHHSAADLWLFVIVVVAVIGMYCWYFANQEKNPPKLGGKRARGGAGKEESLR